MTVIDATVNAQELEEALKHCESERIHQAGHIQPNGVLLALDDNLLICHVSSNISDCFPYSPAELLGKPFSFLVNEAQAEHIRELIGLNDWRHAVITTFDIVKNGNTVKQDAQVSRSGGLWMVEIEHEKKCDGDFFISFLFRFAMPCGN